MNQLAPLEACRSTDPKGFGSEPFCLQGNVLYFKAFHAIEDFERVVAQWGGLESHSDDPRFRFRAFWDRNIDESTVWPEAG